MRRLVAVLVVGSVVVALCATLMTIVVLIGLGVGFSLNWLVPSVDVSSGTIVGVLAFMVVACTVIQLLSTGSHLQMESNEEDEDFEEALSDEQIDALGDRITDVIVTKLQRPRGKRGWSQRARS